MLLINVSDGQTSQNKVSPTFTLTHHSICLCHLYLTQNSLNIVKSYFSFAEYGLNLSGLSQVVQSLYIQYDVKLKYMY